MGTRKKMPAGMIRERVLGEVLKEMPECFGDETEVQEVRYLFEKLQTAEDDKLMELSHILRQKIKNSPLEEEVDKFSYTDSSEKYLEQNRAVDNTLIGYLKNKKEEVRASIEEKKKKDETQREESWEQISCLLKLFRIGRLMECREEIFSLIEAPVPELAVITSPVSPDFSWQAAAVRSWLMRAAEEEKVKSSDNSEVKKTATSDGFHNFNCAVFCSLLERQDLGYVTEELPGQWKIRNRSELVRLLKVRDETVSRRAGINGPEDPILNGELWNYIRSRDGEESGILADFISAEENIFENSSFTEQFFDPETGTPFWKTLEREIHDRFWQAVSGARGSVLENQCQQIILRIQGLLLAQEGIDTVKRRYNRVCRWEHTIDAKHEKARKSFSRYEEQLKILCDYKYAICAGYSATEAEKIFTMLKETMAELNETEPGESALINELLERLSQLKHSLQRLEDDLCHMELSEELEEKAISHLWEERNLANLSLDELEDLIKTSESASEGQMLEQMKTVLIELGTQNWGNELNELPKKVREGFIEQHKSALYRKGRELVASGLFARELEKLKKG